ncbi:lytic transglycosylase domain-containing protein [Thalassospira xiamenensis]|uniref:lytic transglycosylase domain-containing protein n=1 Tax=Thalassospira xiamenensis TaxID=220697 RepID=UPI0007A4F94A|nr:lytic transglycosylase domain-containing protein [Thalassospira xiamenensis]KZB56368.1 lytic transglycosylase [Thalassospira xiamenensis]MCK2167185.1 lytic transglycosylase domain-containing protein [Thalassospira xiamenensis]
MGKLNLLIFLLCWFFSSNIHAQPAENWDREIATASQRFAIPREWVRAVIEVESSRKPDAVSSAGAMGLMQLMPTTWGELRQRYGFGNDPFNPRDNILAGTAYLHEMYVRFGYPGLFAAYHAGPGRYEAHLRFDKLLPVETERYVQKLEEILSTREGDNTDGTGDFSGSALFFPLSNRSNGSGVFP